jgi:hypothetical protein
MTAWTDLVKKIYGENKSKKGYKLGHAMKAAKKVYKTIKAGMKKNGKTAKKRGGEGPEPTKEPVIVGGNHEHTKEPIKMGGKRRSTKHR